MFLLLCLLCSALGTIPTTDTTKLAALTSNAFINPALRNFGAFPFNGAYVTTDEKYWVYVTATGVTDTTQCQNGVDTSCNPQLYSQQIQTVPQSSTDKMLSDGVDSVFYVAESWNGNFLVYLSRPKNRTESSLENGYVVPADASKAAVKVTPNPATDSANSGNGFTYLAQGTTFPHMTSATNAVDDRMGLVVSTTNSTAGSVQNDIWIAYFNGDAPYQLSPALTPFGGGNTQIRGNSYYYGSCFNRIIYETTPTGTSSTLYTSNWEKGSNIVLVQNTPQNNSASRDQNIYWSPSGESYVFRYHSESFNYLSLHAGSVGSNNLLNGGAAINPTFNESFSSINSIQWTPDGKNVFFTAPDTSANAVVNLYMYNPSSNTRTQVSAFSSPNGIASFVATNNWVVFSSTGDMKDDSVNGAVYSWKIGSSDAAFLISPTPFAGANTPFTNLHITKDEKRAVYFGVTKKNEVNLISSDITVAGSNFQCNPDIAQKDPAVFGAVDAVTVSLYGDTEYVTFRYRSGFSTNNNQIFTISSTSTLTKNVVNHIANQVSNDATAQATYGASQPILTPVGNAMVINKAPNPCNIPIVGRIGFTNCWQQETKKRSHESTNCIITTGGQNYVYSRVDTTSTDTKPQPANTFQVSSVDGALAVQTLTKDTAVPIAQDGFSVETSNPWVDSKGEYVVWRVPTLRTTDGITGIVQYNFFYNKVDGKGTLLKLNGDLASATQTVATSIVFTTGSNKGVYFVQEKNFTVYTRTLFYFATLNSDKSTNFDATPTVNLAIDKDNVAQDPFVVLPTLNADVGGNVIYFDSRVPVNNANANVATIAISPVGTYNSDGTTTTVYSTVFPQNGDIPAFGKAYLSKSFRAVALANYSSSFNPPNYNGWVNSGLSSTVAPLLVLVGMFLALF